MIFTVNKLNLREGELLCRKHGVLKLTELAGRVPNLIYISQRYIDLCCFFANRHGFTSTQFLVYVNLLVVHSSKAKCLTALIELILRGEIELAAINSDYIDHSILSHFVELNEVVFIHPKEMHPSLLTVSFKRLFIKYAIHNFYRLFFKRRTCSAVAIRSWVEISKKMYGDKYPTSFILIYPFYLNFSRHIKYIRDCFKTYKHVSLCGLPYTFKELVKIFLNRKKSDKYLVLFEMHAYQKHAEEIKKLGVKELYTTDDFEAGAVAMTEHLKQTGVNVYNTAHGLGFSCPFIKYDFFHVYNEAQKNYYGYKSPEVQYTVAPRVNADFNDSVINTNSKTPVLVFIEASFEKSGLWFETKLQADGIKVSYQTALNNNIDMVIKAHPNRDDLECKKITSNTGVRVIKTLAELSNVKPIFITISSAAYYDFSAQGPFLFIYNGFTNLDDFYGEPVRSYPLEKLENAIKLQLTGSSQ